MDLNSASDQQVLEELQRRVAHRYNSQQFTAGPDTCFIGMVEELGEIAEAMIVKRGDYTHIQTKNAGSIGNEVGDLIMYALSLCNTTGKVATFPTY